MNCSIWRTLLSILIGLLFFNLIVIIHEYFHFLAARICHIDVEYLQLGLGKEIKSIQLKNFKFKLASIPFGGLCKLDEVSLLASHPIKRIVMYLAGPLGNGISALVFFSIYLLIIGRPLCDAVSLSIKQIGSELFTFIKAIGLLITGQAKLSEILSGVFFASKSIGKLTEIGFNSGFIAGLCMMLYLFASVSLSLGCANLLPIPALDGGNILCSLIELFTGRSFSEKFYLSMQILGLILILIVLPIVRYFY